MVWFGGHQSALWTCRNAWDRLEGMRRSLSDVLGVDLDFSQWPRATAAPSRSESRSPEIARFPSCHMRRVVTPAVKPWRLCGRFVCRDEHHLRTAVDHETRPPAMRVRATERPACSFELGAFENSGVFKARNANSAARADFSTSGLAGRFLSSLLENSGCDQGGGLAILGLPYGDFVTHGYHRRHRLVVSGHVHLRAGACSSASSRSARR